jgi:alpha-mannosidase
MKMNFVRNVIPFVKQQIYEQRLPLNKWEFAEIQDQNEARPDFSQLKWRPIELPFQWGQVLATGWFRARVEIPKELAGKPVELLLNSNSEGLLYLNGTPYHGLDHNRLEILLQTAQPGETVEFIVESYYGPESRMCIFEYADLAVANEKIRELYYHLEFGFKVMQTFDANTHEYAHLLNELFAAAKLLDTTGHFPRFRATAETALEYLNHGLFARQQSGNKPQVWFTGHSHIDVAWLWRLFETKRKASRTFSTAMRLMEEFPQYIFMQSTPQLYEYVRENYPAVFEQIKEKIKQGNWEACGGMWVEADCNVTSGESLVRQIIFGKNYFRKEFGVDTKVLWLPDVFGYSWALPQILKKSGIDYFMTAKILWLETNYFPFSTFTWKGIDGTPILTHFPAEGYSGGIFPQSIKNAVAHIRNKEHSQLILFPFGHGDGGGGATREFLENEKRIQYFPELPVCTQGTVAEFFEYLAANTGELPIWFSELYFELHRGTYTTHAKIKKYNRKAELLYRQAEMFGLLANLNPAEVNRRLRPGWEKILLNQFHDIIPGSSIEPVYIEAEQDYLKVLELGAMVQDESVQKLAQTVDTTRQPGAPVVIFNSLGWERSEVVKLHLAKPGAAFRIVDETGAEAAFQITGQSGAEVTALLLAEAIPAVGYRIYFVQPQASSPGKGQSLKITETALENEFLKITLNASGEIAELWDKVAKRVVNAPGQPLNALRTFQDLPDNWEAWDINPEYQNRPISLFQFKSRRIIEQGPVRVAVEQVYESENSKIVQTLALSPGQPFVAVHTWVDWHETRTLLKALFPVDILSNRATYEIQFGSIERPTHRSTSWDAAKFEACGQRWIDLSEGAYGVSLLNDCKYGHHVSLNEMGITLLRSPMFPHPRTAHLVNPRVENHPFFDNFTDQGEHEFSYAIYPHPGDWRHAGTVARAYAFNVPLLAQPVAPHSGSLPVAHSFVAVEPGNIVLDTFKPAENSEQFILRFYESHGTKTRAKIQINLPVTSILETDLMEENAQELVVKNGWVELEFKPFEIKTLALKK